MPAMGTREVFGCEGPGGDRECTGERLLEFSLSRGLPGQTPGHSLLPIAHFFAACAAFLAHTDVGHFFCTSAKTAFALSSAFCRRNAMPR